MSYIYPYGPVKEFPQYEWDKLFPKKEDKKDTVVSTEGRDMKYDKGKLLAAIPFEDFPLAIKELIRVATFGAQKYERSSWKTVPNASTRYNDARARHFLETGNDEESGIDHLAHEAWNCLALLQLKLEKGQRT